MSYKPNRFFALREIVLKLNFLKRATPKRVQFMLVPVSQRVSSARMMLALLLIVSCWHATFAQTGPVDPARETGSPRGSYAQNEYEGINLYNGHADLKIPLLTAAGRGAAKYNVLAPLQSHRWEVMTSTTFNPNGTITYSNTAFGTFADLSKVDPYGPGLLEVVTGLDGGSGCMWTTLARVVLSAPTGAEIELRDDLTDGEPEQQNACPGPVNPVNRGRYFHSSDGSAVKFISDTDIVDHIQFPPGGTFPEGVRDLATGTMITREGTRYRYVQGILTKITDRNGNTLVFEYETSVRRLSRITDSLGRVVNFTYGNRLASQYSDDITYLGIGGSATLIRVNYKALSQILRADQTFKTVPQLFPNINQTGGPNPSDPYDPKLVSSVEFPGNRQFQVAYNSYAEVAKLTLPQGGAVEYDYGGRPAINTFFYNVPDDTGVLWHVFTGTTEIHRRIKERRTYTSGSQLEGTTKYKDIGLLRPVPVEHLDNSGNILFSEKHYFFSSEIWTDRRLGAVTYGWWKSNREFRTEWLNSTGQVVRTVEYNWQQRAPVSWYTPGAFLSEEPSNDPRVADMTTTLNDTGQVTKTTYLYDQFNNTTEEQVLDYGQGTPGGLLRKTQTEYLTINPVNSLDYTSNDIHILNLVKSIRVYGPTSATAQSRTDSEYDNYNDDTNNKPLLPRASIIRLDPVTWVARGNLTKTEYALNVDTGQGPEKYSRYDVAGNIVSTKDPRGNVTEYEYDDAFTDNIPRNTFAFATLTRSAIPDPQGLTGQNTPLVTSMVFDFHTGYGVRATDANNQITITDYNDVYGRPSRTTRPSAGGETNFEYSDVPGNVFVKTLIKQDATRSIETRSYLDGLGKTVRSFLRTGESPNGWIATDTLYDDLGRVSAALEPYAVSTPGPTPGTCGQCTVTSYDEMGRTKTLTAVDGSTLTYSYVGNAATTTDPSGKSKRVVYDALGRSTQIVEDPNGVAHTTTFVYDALGNVRKVVQDQQQRFYLYDSLSRMIRIRNVEDAVNTQLPALTDPITSNSQWSKSIAYDDGGNIIQIVDARNVVTTNTYDRVNRHTGTSYSNDPSGTLPVSKTYDFAIKGKARLFQTKTTGTGGTLVTLEEYDNYGNVLTLKRQFDVGGNWSQPYTTTYTYNLTRGVTSIVYPSGRTVTYHYDDAARADTITGNLGDGSNRNYSTGITYTPFGRIKQELFGTSTAIYNKRFYNSRRQLVEILANTTGNDTTYDRGKILNQFSLQCSGPSCNPTDNNGNVRKQEVFVPANEQASSFTSWHQQYDYDSLNRLKRVTEFTGNPSLNWQQEYDYDRWGNRTINQANTWGPNIPEPAFGVNAANNNRLTAPAGFSLSYDNAGNILADTFSGLIDRVYDARQKMTEARSPGGQLQKYVYDGDGRRVRRNVNGIETWQIHGLAGELLAEYPANGPVGSPQKEYAYRNGEMIVTTENLSPNAPAPSALLATPPASGTNITLNWTAASGAVNYRVERKASGLSFTSIGTTASTSFTDTTAVGGSAYLYKVCAANGSGNCTSPYSNVVFGTSITFTDPTIISFADDPSGATVTTMKAVHVAQLRTAVNAVRSLAGLPNATWSFSVAVGDLIHVEDVRELRTALDAALTVLQVQAPTYTDATIKGIVEDPLNATVIKAAHIRELRLATTKGIGGSGGPASGSVFSINWMVTDHLGTPRMAFSLSGTVSSTRRFDYLPFGEELNASHGLRGSTLGYTPNAADNVRQKFTSQERDSETGLDYFNARYFSSSMGRFTGPDTMIGSFDRPQTLNLYAYVNNNPLRATDPTGNWTFDVIAAFLLGQDQDPNKKPTTSPIIHTIPTPGPRVTVEVKELEMVDGELDRVRALNSANNWIFSRLRGMDFLGLLQYPAPVPMPAPEPGPRPDSVKQFFDNYGPRFIGTTFGGQAGLSYAGNGAAGSFSYTRGVFLDTMTQGDFWSSGGFFNPTKYSASIPAFVSIGAGAGVSLSNAKDASEFVGTSQQVSLATPGAFGGDLSWSRNSSGQLIWTLNVTYGKSFGAGIVTYPSETVKWCPILCK